MKLAVLLLLCITVAVQSRRKRQRSTCKDLRRECGQFSSYCKEEQAGWKTWMTQNCPKTCGICAAACKDLVTICGSYSSYCLVEESGWKKWMTNNCAKTCGFCTISPPTTPAPTTSPSYPTCGIKGRGHTRIVGGEIAAPGDWPWQVTYDFSGNDAGHWCGASIISPHWIVTAAHCFVMSQKTEEYTLTVGMIIATNRSSSDFKLGDFDISLNEGHEQKMNIEKIILHEKYDSTTFDYDIALLKLSNPISYTSRVRPVCLPDDGMTFPTGTVCFVTGWGKLNETGSFPKRLYQAKVPLVDRQTCARDYASLHGHGITDRMVCAGFSQGGIDACQGDSGGPLVCAKDNQWYLMGAVSWGVGCARANAYGVYADVSYLKPWVIETIKKN